MSTAERRQEIFTRALEKTSAAERAAYLEEACRNEPELRAEVESLLRTHAQAKPPSGQTLRVAPPNPFLSEGPGTIIGRYRLLEQIGEGGFGVVYVAEQREPVQRQVALKIIKLGMDTKQVVARFEAERQALALMDHPNIAKVFDAGSTDTGRPYFVMELVKGLHITEYCDQNHLSMHDRLQLFVQVCHAVQHAHQKGIIHRDLKPSNVLVTFQDALPVPKVIDFGIAKATQGRLTAATLHTQLHQFIGTPAYMSPEQAASGPAAADDIDTRSDIYSLGVLLYELLTGTTPFDAETLLAAGVDAIRRTLRDAEPLRPSTKLAGLPGNTLTTTAHFRSAKPPALVSLLRGDLDCIAMKCLEKDRTRRYESAAALAQDILRHLHNEPVVARPPSAAYKFRKAWRRHRGAFSAAAAVAAALVIGLGLSTWAFTKERQARQRAAAAEQQQSRERARAVEARDVANRERDRAARLLAAAEADRGVRLLEQDNPIGLVHLLEARTAVEHLIEERGLRTLQWNGWYSSVPRRETKLLGTTSGQACLAFGSQGDWLVTGSTNGRVTLWHAGSGQQLAAFETGDTNHASVASLEFSANGRLLMVHAGLFWQLWNLDPLRTNQPPVALVRGAQAIVFDPTRKWAVAWAKEGAHQPSAPKTAPGGWTLTLWDATSGARRDINWAPDALQRLQQSVITSQTYGVSHFALALSPDASLLAVSHEALALWNMTTGEMLARRLRTGRVQEVARQVFFSPDGQWLWEWIPNWLEGGYCYRYAVGTRQRAGDKIPGDLPVLSPDGHRLALQRNMGVQLLNAQTGEPIGPLLRHDETRITATAFSPQAQLFATAGSEGMIRFWHADSAQPAAKPVLQPNPVTTLAFSPDGQSLGLATGDGAARLVRLNPTTHQPLREVLHTQLHAVDERGSLLTFCPTNQLVAWRDPSGTVSGPTTQLTADESVAHAELSPDGRFFALVIRAAKGQRRIEFRDRSTAALEGPIIALTNSVQVAFSPRGDTLAGIARNGAIQLWDLTSRQEQARLSLAKPIETTWTGLRFRPDGKFLAARTGLGTFELWDLTARRHLALPSGEAYLAISTDWRFVLSSRGLLDIRDPLAPRLAPQALPPQAIATTEAAEFSSDGRLVALVLRDRTVRVWETATGRPYGPPIKGAASRIRFSGDGRLLFTLESEIKSANQFRGSWRLWDTGTSQPCGPLLPFDGFAWNFWLTSEHRLLLASTTRNLNNQPVPTTLVWTLPEITTGLTEMQRRTWLATGRRVDHNGNIERIPPDAWRALELTPTRR